MENGKLKMENGKWKVENGKSKVESKKLVAGLHLQKMLLNVAILMLKKMVCQRRTLAKARKGL